MEKYDMSQQYYFTGSLLFQFSATLVGLFHVQYLRQMFLLIAVQQDNRPIIRIN